MTTKAKPKTKRNTEHLNKTGAEVAPERDHVLFGGKKVDKIEKFKWRPIKDRPGKFMMLHKSLINIDHGYQRPENTAKAVEIAADFSWVGFGVALIAQREDGSYWAVDAQTRVAGAQMRSDISMVPCMVYKLADGKEEAEGFLVANDKRKPLAYQHKHNAKMRTGDPIALAVNELLGKNGYTWAKCRKEGRYLSCLSILARNLKRDREAMERVFPVVIDAAGGGFILERLLDGFFYLELHGSQSLTDKKWRDRVKKIAPEEYERAINMAAASYVRGGAKRFADGIVDLLNKGMRDRIYINAPSGRE